MTHERLSLGKTGEKLAKNYLQNLGYKIIAVNYRVKLGEIDLVAVDRDTVVFVEVKSRVGVAFGQPSESITCRKKLQLSKVALEYIGRHGLTLQPARFDVVSVLFKDQRSVVAETPQIEVIKNAFELSFGV
jgi:putative endonuclease